MASEVPLAAPQPSQPYLNGRKLALATEWFRFDDPNYDPLPVVQLDGDLVLTDGHTRAFLASLAGADRLRVRPDDDDLQLDVYRTCVGWCRAAAVESVPDLHGRAVDADTFLEQWVRRCQGLTGGDG